jgi:hypothetical protein
MIQKIIYRVFLKILSRLCPLKFKNINLNFLSSPFQKLFYLIFLPISLEIREVFIKVFWLLIHINNFPLLFLEFILFFSKWVSLSWKNLTFWRMKRANQILSFKYRQLRKYVKLKYFFAVNSGIKWFLAENNK